MTLRTPTRLRQWLARPERGAATVEAVIIIPAALAILFGIIHLAMFLYGQQLASAVAEVTYNEARLYNGSATQGTAAGHQHAENIGADTLHNVHINVNRTDTTVTVHVTGQTNSIIPGLPVNVESDLTGPVERWVP